MTITIIINPDKFGTAWLYACRHNDVKTFQILLDHLADPNANCSEERYTIMSILSRGYYFHAGGETREILNFVLKYCDGLKVGAKDVAFALELPLFSTNKGILETLYRYNKSLPVTQDAIASVVASTRRGNSTDFF